MIYRFVFLLLLASAPAHAWWNCDWNYRFAVDINKPPGPPLTDYQVRLDLTAANVPAQFNWNLLGDDIRIVDEDDRTELTFFIERWDPLGQTALLWARIPLIPGGGRTAYVYFDAPPGTPNVSTATTFTETGLKFHTRRSTVDPGNRATAEAAFNSANDNAAGYGCALIDDYTGVFNRSLFAPPNRTGDFGLLAEVFFEVSPADAGVWQFRYGADFGRGGGLYIDDVALDERWNDDLWWAFDWNNSSEVLQGSVNLAPGTHSLRILGFEGCCDGGLTAQFQRPGGLWLAVASANIALVSRKCPATEPVVSFGSVETASCPTISVTRSTQTLSDPFNNNNNPKSIPGAVILNVIDTSNSGAGAADTDSFTVSESIPANTALLVIDFDGSTPGPVQFADGVPASGLSYAFVSLGSAADNVEFSSDNGATYSYTPGPAANGADSAVTNIRIAPGGTYVGNSGAGNPAATFVFKTVVQ